MEDVVEGDQRCKKVSGGGRVMGILGGEHHRWRWWEAMGWLEEVMDGDGAGVCDVRSWSDWRWW